MCFQMLKLGLRRGFSSKSGLNEVVILSAVRTPIGSFQSALSAIPAPRLGAIALKNAIEQSRVSKEEISEVYLGQVIQAGAGQAPARQAALFAGALNPVYLFS